MIRLDLHADRLLDQARKGQLSPDERDQLQAHCSTCAACRMELAWVEDGLHRAAPSMEDLAVAARAVDALLGAQVVQAPAPVKRRDMKRAAIAFCVGLLMASAAAALYTEVRARREREIRHARTAVILERAAPRGNGSGRRGPAQAAIDQLHPPPVAATPSPVPAAPSPPAPAAAAAPIEAAAQDAPAALAPVVTPAPQRARKEMTRVPGDPIEDTTRALDEAVAERLFVRANAERDAGRQARALELYAELARAHPGTRSELAARISHAQLLLRMDQAARARAEFARYLAARQEGALAEEARVGLALCYQRLGEPREERTAWQNVIERHPHSLYAARARKRLSELPP